MNRLSRTRKLTFGAICVALCYVLPLILHSFGGGKIFSPMHFPVLLCGVICGPVYGCLCGILGPILSSILSGTPSAAMLISMIPELVMYGLVSGVIIKYEQKMTLYARVYAALIPAMIAGRVMGGMVKAVVYMSSAESYSIAAWASAYFVKTLPGAILQLVLIPVIVLSLSKAGFISVKEKTR